MPNPINLIRLGSIAMLLQSNDRLTKTRLEKRLAHLIENSSIRSSYRPTGPSLGQKLISHDQNEAKSTNPNLIKPFSDVIQIIPLAIRERLLQIVLVITIISLLLLLFYWCLKNKKSKSRKTRKILIKVKPANLLESSKVFTPALNRTATETKNDQTMSLTNMPIDTDLVEKRKHLKSEPRGKKVKRKTKEKLREAVSDRKLGSSKISTDLQSELKSVYSRSSTLDKRPNDKAQVITQLSTGSEISSAATQRIKKFRESSKAMLVQSRRESKAELPADLASKSESKRLKRDQSLELRRKLHQSRKSRAVMKSRVSEERRVSSKRFRHMSKSIERSADRTTESNKDKSDSDRSDSSSGKVDRKNKDRSTETKETEELKAVGSMKESKKNTKKGANSSLKISSKKLSKRRQSRPINRVESKLNSIKIYDKTIELKNKSNELISIFKQIPDLDSSKLPAKEVLYSPPSKSALKKGKRIMSGVSLSQSSSEEIICQIKRFKVKTKEKIKTKSTEPLLDGEFH